jgi:hypothetical protein
MVLQKDYFRIQEPPKATQILEKQTKGTDMNMKDCYLDASAKYGEALAGLLLAPSQKTREEVMVQSSALSQVARSLTPEQAKSLDEELTNQKPV